MGREGKTCPLFKMGKWGLGKPIWVMAGEARQDIFAIPNLR